MADGIVFTGDTGIAIDNSLVGTTAYRQRIVIGRDGTSSGFANPSTVWPTSDTMGLPVRVVGSSGIVLGMVAPSSIWTVSATVAATTTLNLGPSTELIGRISSGTQTIGTVIQSSGLGASTAIIGSLSSGTAMIGTVVSATSGIVNLSTTSVVGLTTTATVGLTTTSIVNLSSALTNYVTNSTTVPVYLGQSSANVVGIVSQSSNWNLSTAAIISLSSAVTNYVTNSTTVPVYLSTAQLINLSSAITNYVTNSTTVPVYLGQSSGNVVGIVSQSSNWNISTGAVVGLTTTSVVGLTTTSIVNLSSATANYVTNSTTVPVYLGVSSGNVIGQVAPSSQWTVTTSVVNATSGMVQLSSGTAQFGSLGPSSGNVIGLVAPSSQWTVTTSVVNATSGMVQLSSGTAQFGSLGPSSGNVIGAVSQSSAYALSSGTAYVGTVVSASSGLVYFSTTTSVGLTTTNLIGLSTTASIITGVVAVAGYPTAITSGNVAPPMMDKYGRQIVIEGSPVDLVGTTFSAVTANTSMTQLISAPGAGLIRDLLALSIYSTAGTTALGKTTIMVFSSSGQAEPGVWATQMALGLNQQPLVVVWDRSIPGQTANNPWFIVSSSSAATIRAFAHYQTRST